MKETIEQQLATGHHPSALEADGPGGGDLSSNIPRGLRAITDRELDLSRENMWRIGLIGFMALASCLPEDGPSPSEVAATLEPPGRSGVVVDQQSTRQPTTEAGVVVGENDSSTSTGVENEEESRPYPENSPLTEWQVDVMKKVKVRDSEGNLSSTLLEVFNDEEISLPYKESALQLTNLVFAPGYEDAIPERVQAEILSRDPSAQDNVLNRDQIIFRVDGTESPDQDTGKVYVYNPRLTDIYGELVTSDRRFDEFIQEENPEQKRANLLDARFLSLLVYKPREIGETMRRINKDGNYIMQRISSGGEVIQETDTSAIHWKDSLNDPNRVIVGNDNPFYKRDSIREGEEDQNIYKEGVQDPLPPIPDGKKLIAAEDGHTYAGTGNTLEDAQKTHQLMENEETGELVWKELEIVNEENRKVEEFVENHTESVLHHTIQKQVPNFDIRASEELQAAYEQLDAGPLYAVVYDAEKLREVSEEFPPILVKDIEGNDRHMIAEGKIVNIVFLSDQEEAIDNGELPNLEFVLEYPGSHNEARGFAFEGEDEINIMIQLPPIYASRYDDRYYDPMDIWYGAFNGLFREIKSGMHNPSGSNDSYVTRAYRLNTEYNKSNHPNMPYTWLVHLFNGEPLYREGLWHTADGKPYQWYTEKYYLELEEQFPDEIDLRRYQDRRLDRNG